jgi:competence protein ComEC
MKPYDFISVKLSIALILGILIGRFLEISIVSSFLILGLSFLLVVLLYIFEPYRTGIYFGLSILLATNNLGMLAVSLAQPVLWPDHYSKAVITKNPIWALQLSRVLKSSTFSEQYLFEVHSVNGIESRGTLLASVKKDAQLLTYKVDDVLHYWGPILPISPPANPHQFAYDQYMATVGVYDQIQLKAENNLKRSKSINSLRGKAALFQSFILRALEKTSIEKRELGVLRAILLGQRNNLDSAIYEDYQNAGAAHILAVSGLHIGVLLLILQALLKPLMAIRHGPFLRMGLVVFALWSYAFFTGLSPSVVRAVTMFSFIAYALFLNRPTSIVNILALSVFTILLIHPMFLFQVGFQMSYAAVFAIIWIYPILMKLWNPRHWFLKKSWQLFSVSLAAQAGVLPISIFYFHQFPGLFFLSNILIVPFLGILLGLGLLVIFLSAINFLPNSIAIFYNFLLKTMNEVVQWVGQQEQFLFDGLSIDSITLVLGYVLLYFVVHVIQQRRFRTVLKIAICVFSIQLWTFYRAYSSSQNESLIIVQQVANTGLLYQKGRTLQVMTSDSTRLASLADNYVTKEFLGSIQFRPIPNSFSLINQQWLVLDSSAVFPPNTEKSQIILMTQSPRVHLERLLANTQLKLVIADGSNYTSDIARWKRSCIKFGLPFYATSEKGAYLLKFE